jgi:hypothetical protein
MSQPNNTSSGSAPNTTQQAGAGSNNLVLPSEKTLLQATKLSLKTKKPICFYFYIDSLKGKITIVTDGEDRIIFKSEDEHTSPILNTYKSDNSFIVVTENTIYILSADTPVR